MVQEKITRQQLYELVWTEPLLTLSKKFEVSDVGLRKICIRMEIPLPKAGHWQRLKFGKGVDKPRLSTKYAGEQEVILRIRMEEMKAVSGLPSPEKMLRQKIENDLNSRLSVPEKLTKPDQLIVAAKESLKNRDRYEHNGLISCERGELDIKVSRANIPRALRFLDTLIKALRARGHSIEFRHQKTNVIIDGQAIEIQFREKLRKEIVKETHWNSTVYHPAGILALQINSFGTKEWKDGTVPLEQLLSKIIAKLEIVALEKKEWQIKRDKEHEIWERQEKARKENEKRKETDLSNFKEMLVKSSRWHKAVNLRDYIDAIEQKAKAMNQLDEKLELWLSWARKKADWYDPFLEIPDELLDEIDRETLESVKKGYTFS